MKQNGTPLCEERCGYFAHKLSSIIDSTCPEAGLHFCNIQGRHEADFIVEAENRCIAIEVKSAARWESGDLSGLKAFLSASPDCIAAIPAHNGRGAVRLGDCLWAIPLDVLLF